MSYSPLEINSHGLAIIKECEGLRTTAYKCPAGVWTIGYGHTHGVKDGETITAAEAERLLKSDVKTFERILNDHARESGVRLNENEFSALVSFTYNLGVTALINSTLWTHLKNGSHDKAAAEFPKWVKAGGRRLTGLMKRRQKERELFESPSDVTNF